MCDKRGARAAAAVGAGSSVAEALAGIAMVTGAAAAAASPPLLRPATVDDLPALLALEAGFPGDRLSRRQFRHHLANPRALLRVAVAADGGVLGYSMLLRRQSSGALRLYSLAVADAARGRGLGALLLADAEAAARGGGGRELRLEVRADNLAAQRLYRAAGFTPCGLRSRYYEDGVDALRLCKRLLP